MAEQGQILCVVGPTACGKTRLGAELARCFGGEVVGADSMQIYRGMAIGTAAPTAEEMLGVPHHMIGVADPREAYPSGAMWRRPPPAWTISWRGESCPWSWAAQGFISTRWWPGAASPPAARIRPSAAP